MSSSHLARRAPLLTLALALAAVANASAQGPQPRTKLYPCYRCIPAEYPPGGFKCDWGYPNGGTSCFSDIIDGVWFCETFGSCSVNPLQGDSLDVAVVSDGGAVALMSRVGPSTFNSGHCSDRRLYVVDGDGLVLGFTERPEASSGSAPAKRSQQ